MNTQIVGKYAFVGAGSVVTTNIKNYALYVGNPRLPYIYDGHCHLWRPG